ncbi:MAG: electron transfer flavoprotein subunit alpha/FixB family protein [Actinomycetales bacterium]|nr:electron transfer flavoprotein subunit alpha/FixB family protein [Actinomycetales bacterium]
MRLLVVVPATPSSAHREAITAARGVGTPVAVTLGDPDLAALAELGVSQAVALDLGGRPQEPTLVADGVLAAVRQVEPDAVVLVSSFAGKAVAARLAVALRSAAIVDVTGLRVEGDRVIASKTVLAGTWQTECTVVERPAILAMKPAAVRAVPAPVDGVEVTRLAVEPSPAAGALRRESRIERPRSGRPALDEARVVVAGGRGTDGDFTLVEELADLLGGAVGATRVATDEGWIDHSAQIGQTGTMISPTLYIGAGISGAVHHTAGMQAAQTVVVINSDPEAPLFEFADFGVVGDLHDVLRQAIDALRAR